VRIQAEVEDVYSPHTFTLDEDEIGASPDVLVLMPAPRRAPEDDADVTVTGIVRQFVQADLERDYDWLDFDAFGEPDVVVRLKTRPVVVADSVRTKDGAELVQAPKAGATAGTRDGGMQKEGKTGAPAEAK
jgi:hypothetical protein